MKTIKIDGIIGWDVWADSVKRQMASAKGEDLTFEISSVGGDVFTALEIFNAIRDYEGKTSALIVSIAASSAAYIASAVDDVKVYDNSIFMIHNPWTYGGGDYNDFAKTADILESLANVLGLGLSQKANQSEKKTRAQMDEETWLFGSGIKEAGFADQVIEAEKTDDSNTQDQLVAKAKVDFLACLDMMAKDTKKQNEIQQKARDFVAKTKPVKPKPVAVKKDTKMKNIEEIKAQYPELFAQIVQMGIDAERDRVKAHANYLKAGIASDHAIEAIMTGTEMTASETSFYNVEGIKSSALANVAADTAQIDAELPADNGDASDPKEESSIDGILAMSTIKPWEKTAQ